jgi:hypothetical protein
MKNYLFSFLSALIFLLITNSWSMGQKVITWKNLEDVTYKEKFSAEADAYFWFPTFGKSVLDMEGKEVQIKGYVIPVDVKENLYVLSAFPFAACFFCGGAGPQTVLELAFAKKPRRYETDERLTFKGKFKLNPTDIYRMNYILESAEQVKE